jgi:toxin CcdB
MKQFDLYINTDKDTNSAYPYFVAVQIDLLDSLNTRVVIPISGSINKQAMPDNLCPKITIDNKNYYLLTHQITTVSASFLKEKDSSLLPNRDEIIAALDFLFTGI